MHRRQRTIRTSKSCKGVGLHTGVDSVITFHPAPENYGVRFVRSDIKDSPEIKADIDHVVDISRGTTIEQNDVRIHTVEHALAAVNGLRIDNVMIELNNKETPVMDGSAKDFVDALLDAGIKKQEAKRKVLKITRAVNYTDYYRDIDIHVIPSDNFRVTFLVEYPLPALGTQYEAIYNMEEDFAFEVAPARTFCFLSEIEMLKEQGLIKGGALDNALVIIDKKIDRLMDLMPNKVPPDMSNFLLSPMPGLLVSIAVKEGDKIEAGQELAIVEAMKMENVMKAESDAIVAKIHATPGTTLGVDQPIIEFE